MLQRDKKRQERKHTIPLAKRIQNSQPKTLKLKEIVKNKNVTILVDLGSTHNSIDIDIAKQLNIFVYPTKDIIITIIDGKKIKGVGRCH